jgi:hypothetical protein
MATHTTVTAVGEKETLADIIYKVDSDETPIFSSIAKESSNGIFTEWQVQELAATNTSNFVAEGADMSDTGVTATARLGNYHQISQKGYIISKTLEQVDKAGRAKEVAYQRVLKGLELRRDIEKMIGDTDVARVSGATRKSASLSCWITNGSVGATGSFATGDGTDAVSAGTARALTLALLDDSVQDAWEDGGAPSMLVASATNRANISDLAQAGTNLVTNQVNTTQNKAPSFVGSVSVYLTDFGTLDITPSRFLSNDRIFVIDPNYVSLSTINGRNFAENEIAPTGDAEKSQIICEWALKVKAPKAHGMILDLNGS